MHTLYTVIQGPTQYYKEMIDNYKGVKNLCWSTWKSEPEEALKAIEAAGIKVILNDGPKVPGVQNINYQCKSVMGALEEIGDEKGKYLKIRSDFLVKDPQEFITTVEKHLIKNSVGILGYYRSRDFGTYILDYIFAGDYNSMTEFWCTDESSEMGGPFPEKFLTERFFKTEINHLLNKKHLFLDLKKTESIYWIKNKASVLDEDSYYRFKEQGAFTSRVSLKAQLIQKARRLKYSLIPA